MNFNTIKVLEPKCIKNIKLAPKPIQNIIGKLFTENNIISIRSDISKKTVAITATNNITEIIYLITSLIVLVVIPLETI
jgi:hypothetical protein